MTKLKYKKGQERDIVLEKSDYKDSVFHDQYTRSLNLLNAYVSDLEDRSLKTIAFCGGRGDGKTSCMKSVLDIIDKAQDTDSPAYNFIKNSACRQISSKRFNALDVIDPAFFDDNHNVLEIIIGHLYNAYHMYSAKISNPDLTQKNQLQTSFQEVKRSLFVLSAGGYDSINDLTELSVLSASITLHHQMETLIERYLKFIDKDVLIIPIDDMDLNMDHAYRMCEQIRKYLCIPRCVVMISLKIDQLEKVVSYIYRKSIKNETYISDSEIHEMAERYLNKLLPISSRIYMPNPYELGEIDIDINDGSGIIIERTPLKMALAQLIFYRTRYLFYNPVSGSSPIVPNNMRDIFNMVGLLASMKTAEDSQTDYKDALNENKRLFKSYFYSVWIGQFDNELKSKLHKLVNFDFGTSFNREVISILQEQFKTYFRKDYQGSEGDESEVADVSKDQKPVNRIINSIKSSENFGYNISIGDVFYILSILESETLEESQYALIFFLKSLYSIMLYEAYDEITEKSEMIYPSEQEDKKGLTIVDRRFDHVNIMQQLIDGSYFTYSPGELIPKGESDGYDMRIIGSKEIYALIKDVKDSIDDILELSAKGAKTAEEESKIDKFNMHLNIMEFFIMTLTAQVPQKKTISSVSGISPAIEFMNYARKNVDPYRFRKFNRNSGYFLFDILAPFATILNPRFAYTRFPQIDDSLYEKIFNYKGSLLNKMIEECSEFRQHIRKPQADNTADTEKNRIWQKLHRLLSDAAIRNGEVSMAVKNNIAVRRREKHDGPEDTLRSFYANIQNSGMKTLKRSPEGKEYEITFRFLNPLQNILKNAFAADESDDSIKEWKTTFSTVFNCHEPASRRTSYIAGTDSIFREPDMIEIRNIIGKATRVSTIRKKILNYLGKEESAYLGNQIVPGAGDKNMKPEEVYNCIRKFINDDTMSISLYRSTLRNKQSDNTVEPENENQVPEDFESMNEYIATNDIGDDTTELITKELTKNID